MTTEYRSIDRVNLETLPEDDPLRTTPLHLIGAEFMHFKAPGEWKLAAESAHFHGFTYNDLYGPWTTFHRWRAPRTPY